MIDGHLPTRTAFIAAGGMHRVAVCLASDAPRVRRKAAFMLRRVCTAGGGAGALPDGGASIVGRLVAVAVAGEAGEAEHALVALAEAAAATPRGRAAVAAEAAALTPALLAQHAAAAAAPEEDRAHVEDVLAACNSLLEVVAAA